MEASIFMASIVATESPAETVSPSETVTVTAPANGAATWPGWDVSAFSVSTACDFTDSSRISSRRSWPLRVTMTVRMPFSSGSEMACRVTSRRTPLPSEITCSWSWSRP